jgi:hypothetical protein
MTVPAATPGSVRLPRDTASVDASELPSRAREEADNSALKPPTCATPGNGTRSGAAQSSCSPGWPTTTRSRQAALEVAEDLENRIARALLLEAAEARDTLTRHRYSREFAVAKPETTM